MTSITFSCVFVMINIRKIAMISTLSRCMVVIGLLLTLRMGVTQTGETSKACYGVGEIPCTSHHLNCINGIIAIREAYYTDNTQCGGGLSSCNINVSKITDTGNHNEFNAAEWDILQRNCSSQAMCEFKAGRRFPMVFSVVQYNCIQDTVNLCNEIHNQQISDPSLIWTGNGSIGQEHRICSCSLYAKVNDVNVNITSLDLRMYNNQTACTTMTINTDDDVVNVKCSSWIRPYDLLTHATHVQHVVIGIPQPSIHGQIWIQIQGSTQFSLHCPPNESSTTVTETTAVISTTYVRSSSTSHYAGTTESTPLMANNSFPGGMFMAGVVTGAVTVILVVLVVYVVVTKHRCDITDKKPDGVPTSMEHPTYSGLSARDPANTYEAFTPDVAIYTNDSIRVDESCREHGNA